MTTDIKQCWSANGEDFIFQSLRELLDAGADLAPGDVVHVGEADYPDTHQLIDASDVMDQMTDRAWDIAGEYAMDYPDVSNEAKAELESLLSAWITKHCPPTFFVVKNSKEYTLTTADMDAA